MRDGRFDVVTFFECVHDMADPVAVLAAARAMVRDDGYVLVADERTQESFTAPAGPARAAVLRLVARRCACPDGRSTTPSVATGTVMRPATLERYAREAGFAGIEILPVELDLLRFYRLLIPAPEPSMTSTPGARASRAPGSAILERRRPLPMMTVGPASGSSSATLAVDQHAVARRAGRAA